MVTLPSGTVTFLFTDVEGSTRLWEQHPEAMKAALAEHDAILRQAVEAHSGKVIKTTGDGVHAVFSAAEDGVHAALAAQRAIATQSWEMLAPQSIRVRMGVHCGEAELRGGDYYGSATNRAARLTSCAHGGQILLSQAAAELVRDGLPEGASLADLGEHRLKDLARPERFFQLIHPSLPRDFPPLDSLDAVPNNLPTQLTSFIGREKEIAEIRKLLDSARLVTLTGSGGTGKTRLALEVGAQMLEEFQHGVWLLELAPLGDAAQVLPLLARVLGLQELPHKPLENLVTEYLHAKKALLILDNCEHLIEACAHLADELLHHCPGLKILASSREALGIGGEAAYRIPSLAESEAVQLFVERACAVNSSFNFSKDNTVAVAQVCRRLDGIPLAIELAAARARLLSPEQITARLNDRFRLLVGGSRTALPRQQTLRALVDWSYDLLSEDERRLLRVASVFVGGWTLEALEEVAEDAGALELLEQLVNKSLVATEDHGSTMRYVLLETIRQYAREKLLDSGVSEAARVRSLHLGYYVQLAESSVPRLIGPEMVEALDELELEQDNLRAAVEWAIENDPISALRMAELLPTFWGRRLSATEGYVWIRRALDRAEESNHLEGDAALPYLHARAIGLLGEAAMAFQRGDNLAARSAIEASIALARQTGAEETLAYALALGATINGFLGDVNTARTWSEESQSLSRRHGFAYILAQVTGVEAFLAVTVNQPVPPGLAEEVMRVARASGNPWALGMAFTNVGRLNMVAGHWAESHQLLAEAAALFQKLRDKSMYNSARSEMGHLLRIQGRYTEAAELYRETIQVYQEMGEQAAVAHELECFAFIAAAQSQKERAACLLGAAEALRESLNTDMTPIERREYEKIVADLNATTEDEVFKRGWSRGSEFTVEQAIQLAVALDQGG